MSSCISLVRGEELTPRTLPAITSTEEQPGEEAHKCFRVSGIGAMHQGMGEKRHLNGIYHPEPEDSDGVPCYRQYCSIGRCSHTITRRHGYWFIDFNHRGPGEDFSNEGSCVRLDKPPERGWFLTPNGSGGMSLPYPDLKVEETDAPYHGWVSPEDEPIHEYDEAETWNDDEEYYEGEYENEDLPEDNTEKAKEIKDAVKAVGEKVFDLQDQLKEGDYLELMNLLQQVTNKTNSY